MKTTNKKLAKKHFRYLNKKERKDPLGVIIDLYDQQTEFEVFRLQVNLLLLGGLDGRLRRNGFEYHYIGCRLKRQIEVAYILYVDIDMKNKVNYNPHSRNIREMYAILKRHRVYDIKESIVLFFEYQSLARWLEDVDCIVSNASFALDDYHHATLDDCLIIYHYVITLIDTLHQIYQDGGLEIDMPNYLKPRYKDGTD